MRRDLTPTTPRVIASDLDGTLLRADGSLSPRTRRALVAVHDRGIETVFVTGRPPRWVDHLADAVGGHGIVLCGNGAFRYDVRLRRVTHVRGIGPADVGAIVRDVRTNLPGAVFAAELGMRIKLEPQFMARARRAAGSVAGRSESIGAVDRIREPVGKLLIGVSGCEGEPAQLVSRVGELIGARGTVVTSGVRGLIEVGPPGVTKASALAAFCAEHGVRPNRVWAFGDELNDLPMLEWAGRSFAVGEAHPLVRAAATDEVEGPESDGVARVLEALLG